MSSVRRHYLAVLQLIRDLKSLVFLLQNRKNHPEVRIGFGSRVIDSAFGTGVTIGKNCYVQTSKFGREVFVKDKCAISNSTFEDHTAIYPNCSLNNVRFGSYSYVSEHALMGRVTVGKFSSIGPHFLCGYGEHPTDFISTSPVFYSTRRQCGISFTETNYFEEHHETIVGSDVWIGARVFVRDGVRIGNGAMIAAGAVVTADVPDYALVGGVPAKVIRYRFPEDVVRELLEIKWWEWSEDQLREAQPLFAQPDVNSFLTWAKQT
jgi:acetyltransferase-like isoleucine patch superfamily enzyme